MFILKFMLTNVINDRWRILILFAGNKYSIKIMLKLLVL